MSANRSVEITGTTIEEAIEKGLQELEVSRASVIVEILEEPSRGLLGIGSRQARVKLTTAARPKAEVEAEPPKPEPQPEYEDEIIVFAPAAAEDATLLQDSEIPDDARVGREKLMELLNLLDIEADVVIEASYGDTNNDMTPVLQLEGDDLGALIGRKGESLAALQYITRLIASHAVQRRVKFVVDAGRYKSKRAETLRRLAERMAEQAIERGRTVRLEPMPPHERRIIHMALRNRRDVTTSSVGEGDLRKVTIIPQRS